MRDKKLEEKFAPEFYREIHSPVDVGKKMRIAKKILKAKN